MSDPKSDPNYHYKQAKQREQAGAHAYDKALKAGASHKEAQEQAMKTGHVMRKVQDRSE